MADCLSVSKIRLRHIFTWAADQLSFNTGPWFNGRIFFFSFPPALPPALPPPSLPPLFPSSLPSLPSREQRVTLFVMAVLIGISMMLYYVLRLLPLPVLYGIFLYIGVASLYGVQVHMY